ncbi:MAG: FAD-binding oxidoreductase [Endomicrobium sp.]|jgi:D-lactate dehydrogenase (cytochrome)|nr:FAD-binding oxidoreductase [Endomicrobium sp.]
MIIKKDQSTIISYFEDASGMRGAFADFAAIAENEKDISDFLIEASNKKIPVTIAAALTANTGAGLAFGGAVLSLEKLNQIGSIQKINNQSAYIKVGAGARLADIKDKVFKEGWLYPPDPTEKNSLIGGNISTNASGGRSFKFGSTRKYVKSLKIIFTDGSSSQIERGKYKADSNGKISFDTDKGKKDIVLPKYKLPHIKNAAGYYNEDNADLIDIFIGSEGTLGVIAEADLFLIPAFKELFGGVIFFNSQNAAFDFAAQIKSKVSLLRHCGLDPQSHPTQCGWSTAEIAGQARNDRGSINPMSLEYMDKNALDLVRPFYPQIPSKSCAAIMFEQDIYDGDNADDFLEKWLSFMQANSIDENNIWFAQNSREMQKFLQFRHKIPETVNEIVQKNKIPKVGTDFAVPQEHLSEIYDFCEKEFKKSGIFYLIFGHIGENHLHANIIASNDAEFQKTRQIYEKIIEKVVKLGGTASAEHGIGKLRHVFLEKMVGNFGLQEMSKFKKSLDPFNILGIGNIFPQ